MRLNTTIAMMAFILTGMNGSSAQESDVKSILETRVTAETSVGYPAQAPGPVLDVIKDAEGEIFYYQKSCSGYFRNYSAQYVPYSDAEIPAHIVFDGDDVYFFNILSKALTNSFAKGVRSGNKISLPLPQTLLYNEQLKDGYNLARVKPVTETTEDGTEKTTYVIDNEGEQMATYTISDDGTITMDDMGDGCGIGLVFINDDVWGGYTDVTQVYAPISEPIVTVPDNVKCDEWALTTNGSGYYVKVGFDGKDVYIGGMCGNVRDAWFKGYMDGDKIRVPSGQLVGIYSDTYYVYVKFAERIENTITLLPEDVEFVFDYDAEKKSMTVADQSQLFLFNVSPSKVSILQMFEKFRIHYQDTLAGTPDNPFNLWYSTANYEWYGFNEFNIDIPRTSTAGDLLDPDCLYYQILMDGEVMEFLKEDYDIEKDMTNIPYLYDNSNDIYSYGGSGRAIGIYADDGFDTLGVQLFYSYDGVLTESAIATLDIKTGEVTYSPSTGIKEVSASEGTVVKRDYYDVSGRLISHPEKGSLCIERITLSNGNIVSRKSVIR